MVLKRIVPLALFCAACDPVRRIAVNTNSIRTEAQALIEYGNETGDPTVVARATKIDGLAAGIHEQLPNVTNKVPAWLDTLHWWGIALAGLVVLVIAWQSGAFSFLRIAVGWLPKRKVAQAELAVDMLDESRPEGDRELVAAMRAQDSEFDAAFRKLAQQRRKAKA